MERNHLDSCVYDFKIASKNSAYSEGLESVGPPIHPPISHFRLCENTPGGRLKPRYKPATLKPGLLLCIALANQFYSVVV